VFVNGTKDTITFASEHSFYDGQLVTYHSNLDNDTSGLIDA